MLIGYSQDFVAQDKCEEVALNQIAQGSKAMKPQIVDGTIKPPSTL